MMNFGTQIRSDLVVLGQTFTDDEWAEMCISFRHPKRYRGRVFRSIAACRKAFFPKAYREELEEAVREQEQQSQKQTW